MKVINVHDSVFNINVWFLNCIVSYIFIYGIYILCMHLFRIITHIFSALRTQTIRSYVVVLHTKRFPYVRI